ncbi:MAG: dienelactone hydrolase family protein [Deltaproteobacteria bacterium]|nr:dienelactone hydrolase family protein [Deltaproteobacteria bacterium]
MELRPLTLPTGGGRIVRAVLGVPRTTTMAAILVLAHGANNDMEYPLIAGLHEKLARQGLVTVRFNFPYSEEGRKRPDPDATLEGVYRLVLEHVAELDEFKGLALYLGGKSMGARLAAQLVAQEVGASGLVFLGYPLHPPGRPEQLRDKPLYLLPCPSLFIEGARDPFCRLDLLAQVLGKMPVRTDLHLIPGAGHSFESGHGVVAPEVMDEICRVILGWLDSL